jgi:alpha 1,3-glucosidase
MDGEWEPAEVANPLMSGRWSEMWSTYNDTKPRGPQDVALDVTFINAKHLFGLPEHASSFALKRTVDRNGTALREPFRLYNLDVFEYEVDNEMALYGAVPMVLTQSSRAPSCGMFWFNAAETWVDFADGNGGANVDSHWMSESGALDVFFMLGPSGADVLQQYALITGTTPLPPRFATAYHQCKWNYRSETEVMRVDERFDDSDIPYDVLWLDIEHTDSKKYFTWDPLHFKSPLQMQQHLRDKGRKVTNSER